MPTVTYGYAPVNVDYTGVMFDPSAQTGALLPKQQLPQSQTNVSTSWMPIAIMLGIGFVAFYYISRLK